MKLMCRVFGHDIRFVRGRGINPRLMKVIERNVRLCNRGDFTETEDVEIEAFDLKKGVNLWGSGGVCMGCAKAETCEYSSSGKPYMMVHCPIVSFQPKSLESFVNTLNSWGDTLIE